MSCAISAMSIVADDLEEDTCDYYYGNISRETAEYILWDRGCVDSTFLLRKSNSDYVLSLCFQKSILHYRISRLATGEVILHGLETQKFANLDKLLEGVEGLAIKPSIPCDRSSGWQLPPTYWGLSVAEIRTSIIKKSHEWGFADSLVRLPMEYLSSGNEDYNQCLLTEVTKSLINKTLHEIQPWFHGKLSRLEAERSLEESGHKEGKFLVRERDQASYALCVSHEGTAKHYRIDILSSGELAIQDGHKFPSIMSLVSHYTVFTDGLWTSLGEPCPRIIRLSSPLITNSDLIFHQASTLRPSHFANGRRNHFNFRSPSLERSRNMINRERVGNRAVNAHTSVRLKEWLSTINQKWSQLLSVVTTKNCGHDRTMMRGGQHFSTLPRNHLLMNPRHPYQAQPSLYDYTRDGPHHSLNFRSLNVEMMSTNFNHNRAFINQPIQPTYETHHYQETDILTNRNALNTSRPPPCKLEAETDQRVCLAGQHGDLLAVDDPQLIGCPRITKSASLEDIYSSHRVYSQFQRNFFKPTEPPPKDCNNQPLSSTESSCNRTVPTPVPRKAKPTDTVHYANHEVIRRQRNDSLSSGTPQNSSPIFSEKVSQIASGSGEEEREDDLSMFDPIVGRDTSSGHNCNAAGKERQLNCVHQDSVLNEAHKCSDSLIELFTDGCFAETSLSDGKMANSSEKSTSSDLSNSKTLDQAANEVDQASSSGHDAHSLILERIKVLGQKEKQENCDPIYEEINEDCSRSCDSEKKQVPLNPANNQLMTANGVEKSEAQLWTALADSRNPMYEYDALKFDRDLINKDASLGLTSLEANKSGSQVKLNELDLICLEEDPDQIDKSLSRYRQGPLCLDPKFITFKQTLGSGYFGEVYLATIPSSTCSACIQVAVKVLKIQAIPNHKGEILKEAQTMSSLDHKHIVRLIGVCETDPIMIVMELAPLGPLNQYLIDHGFCVSIKDIIALLLQVAMAMQYLESKQFIHRDLAARNVLLVNEKFAKVSDFGMSRALGIGKEYYRAKSASKWPLKWYAPECIYYFKFSTKSDVWSYGVTMWESLSYGQKPYEGMDGQDILRLFRENRRLPRPDNCPQEIYQLMWKCWQFRPEDRPTFAEICQTMTTYFLCSDL